MSHDTAVENLHVIFGSGPVGLAVMDSLRAKQQRIRMVNRSGRTHVPDDVELITGDASDLAFARHAAKGAAVVYNTLAPPYHRWPKLFPALQHSVLEAAAAAEAKLVVMENLYMYGNTHGKPMDETFPYSAQTAKGKVRAAMSTELLAAHQAGKVRVTIGRASDFFGPRVRVSTLGQQVFQAALKGRAAQVFGNPDQLHSYTYISDVGAALVLLGEQEAALGQAWHIPNAQTLTTRQVIDQIFQQAGSIPKYQVLSSLMLRLVGIVNPSAGEMVEMLYEFEAPFVVNHSKFSRQFGDLATPIDEAIATTLQWYRSPSIS